MVFFGLDVLLGKGFLVLILMFNRICRLIFIRRESNLNRGWLRVKV